MEAEEDMFLVIVGDETVVGSSNQNSASMSIKQISLDETEGVLAVDDLLEMAERHFDIREIQEPGKLECEYLAEESHLQPMIIDLVSNYDEADDDKEYIPEDEDDHDDDDHVVENYMGKTEVHRYTMLKPSQRKSFVSDLRRKFQELREDKDLLIITLSGIMRSVKAPPLPKDYYVMDFNKPLCIECGAKTDSIPAAGRHYQEKHGQRYLVCYACGVDFRSTTNLYKHEKRCAAPDAQVVLRARAACLGRKGRSRPYLPDLPDLPRHKGPAPTDDSRHKYPCSECSAVLNSKVTLQSHQYLHRGEKPFQCHICPSAYTSHSALLRHTKTHSDVQYICDHCKRSFKVKAALVTHMDTHKPVRKFACGECGRRFAQRAAMLLHVHRDHRLLPPPCACQICPKRYPRMSLLKAHMKKAHGMTLMTRKMFSKLMPTMTETQLQQAKVVHKSEAPSLQDIYENENSKRENNEKNEMFEIETNFEIYDDRFEGERKRKCVVYNNSELDTKSDNTIEMDEFMQYVDMLQNNTELDNKPHKVFIIKNGEVINLKGSVSDESKIDLSKDNESLVEVTEDSIEPQIKVEMGELKILSMPSL